MVIKNGKTMKCLSISRSSHQKCSVKKGVLKNFANVTGKNPVLESLFDKVPCLQACNFILKRLQHRYFPVKFAIFLRTPIWRNICERLLYISYDLNKYVSQKLPKGLCKIYQLFAKMPYKAILANPSIKENAHHRVPLQ